MSTLIQGARPRRRPRGGTPSVREVCLLGTSADERRAAGDRLRLHGRAYRVAATQAAPGYLHLAAELTAVG